LENLSLIIAESLQLRWGQLLVNLCINLKSIFMTFSHLYGFRSSQPDYSNTIIIEQALRISLKKCFGFGILT